MVTNLPQNHGWDDEFNYMWTEEVYPEAMTSFLANTFDIKSNNVESEASNEEVWVEEKDDHSRSEFEEDPGSVEKIFEVECQDEIDYQ